MGETHARPRNARSVHARPDSNHMYRVCTASVRGIAAQNTLTKGR